MYELARPAIYSYSIQRGTPHVNLRQKRASLFNSQILVVALIGIFGGLKPKMCVHFSKDWRSDLPMRIQIVRSCERNSTSRTSKLAINSFNSMNRSLCIRNAQQCLTDITEVVFAFRFSVKYDITSSTIICGRHFYFGWLVRI